MRGAGRGRRRFGGWLFGALDRATAPPEPVVAPGEPDLLAEERQRPLRRWAGRLGLTGGRSLKAAGVMAALFFALWGAGQYGLLDFGFGGDGGAGSGGGVAGAVAAGAADGYSGTALPGGAVAKASRYGRLTGGLGRQGLPLIEHRVTGELREVTAIELEFTDNRLYEPIGSTGQRWSPGPAGLGLWWQHDPVDQGLSEVTVMDRWNWQERQEAELEVALREVEYAVRQFDEIDFIEWEFAPAARAEAAVINLRRRHPALRESRFWSGVPTAWQCDAELERDLDRGAGPGCPSGELTEQLSVVWDRLGRVAERVEELAWRAKKMSAMDQYFLNTLQLNVRFGYDAVSGQDDVDELRRQLKELRRVSKEQGLPLIFYFLQ